MLRTADGPRPAGSIKSVQHPGRGLFGAAIRCEIVRAESGPRQALGHRASQQMEPMMPDFNVEILAQEMIKHFPADAADQAALRSSAFFHLGYIEKSKKWLLVRALIKKILADAGTEGRARSITIGAN